MSNTDIEDSTSKNVSYDAAVAMLISRIAAIQFEYPYAWLRWSTPLRFTTYGVLEDVLVF